LGIGGLGLTRCAWGHVTWDCPGLEAELGCIGLGGCVSFSSELKSKVYSGCPVLRDEHGSIVLVGCLGLRWEQRSKVYCACLVLTKEHVLGTPHGAYWLPRAPVGAHVQGLWWLPGAE